MKVFMVTEGSYSDYSILAVFSTKEKAEEAREALDLENEIEEYEMDAPSAEIIHYRNTKEKRYSVYMDEAGNTSNVYKISDIGNKEIKSTFEVREGDRYTGRNTHIYAEVFAQSKEHAIKITNEKRVQFIALNKWRVGETL